MALKDESAADGAGQGGKVNPEVFDRKAKKIVRTLSRDIKVLEQDTVITDDMKRHRIHDIHDVVINFLENASALTTVTSKAALADFRGFMRRVPKSLASALRAFMPKVEYAWEQADKFMSGTAIRVRQTRCNCVEARIGQRNMTEVQDWMKDLVVNLQYGTVHGLIPKVRIALNDLLPAAEAKKIMHTVVRMGDSTVKIASSMDRGMHNLVRTYTSVLDNKLNCTV